MQVRLAAVALDYCSPSMERVRAILHRAVSSRAFVFLLVAAAFAVTTKGRLKLTPDSPMYLSLAEAIQHARLTVFATTTKANFTIIIFPSLIALARTLAPVHWQLLLLAVNTVCAAVTAVLLVDVVGRVTSSSTAAAVALVFYICCFDIFIWVSYLVTDHLYAVIATYAFVLSVRGVLGRDGPQPARRVKLLVAIMVTVVTRPVGIVLVPPVLLTEWFFVGGPAKRNAKALWLFVGSGVAVAFLAHAYFFQDLSRWPFQWMRPKLQEYASRERAGEVVYDRHETFHRPPVTMTDFESIAADRFVRFLQITSTGYSRSHNVVAVFYYGPLYLLAVIGVIGAFRTGEERQRAVLQTALLWLVANATLSAITTLDFDFRYRMPLMPQIILLGAFGAYLPMRYFAPVDASDTLRAS